MDSAVAFDPSTAKPVSSFDPASARASKAPSGVGAVSPRAQALKETIVGPGVGQKQAFDAQADIEKKLRAEGKSDEEIQNDPAWQASAKNLNRASAATQSSTAIGAAGGDVGAAALGPLAKLAAKAAPVIPKAGATISRLLPGATGRAEQGITKIAPSFDKDAIGRSVLKTLRPDYDALYATRAGQLMKVAKMEEGPEKTAAFRRIYQDPRYAKLREFEDSPLGAKAVATTSKYSSTPKVNPKTFIDQAFRSPQDVRELKALYNGDQKAVEQVAAKYASSELKGILENAKATSVTEANPLKSEAGNVATALTRWRVQNSDWLKEVPATKHVVDDFVDNMVAVARTQKHFKIATVAGMTLGLFDEGFHPWSWVKGLMGGVE